MKERPILMSTENVKAILEGRKTQTRRVIKPQPKSNWTECMPVTGTDWNTNLWNFYDPENFDDCGDRRCPYGQAGDRLIVRESHKLTKYEQDGETWVKAEYRMEIDGDGGVRHFKWADIPKRQRDRLARIKTWGKWRPARFMYRFLARITLEITEIRVERLQEIAREDIKAEGFDGDYTRIGWTYAFGQLWNELNEKRGYPWESNSWVWVISFKRING